MVTFNKIPNSNFLSSALEYVDYIMIEDNASNNDVVNFLLRFRTRNLEKIILRLNQQNKGLSVPFNEMVAELRGRGVHWFFFFDSDALVDINYFTDALSAWENLTKRGENVGIVTSIVADTYSLLGENLGYKQKYSRICSAITSGLLTNIEVFDRVGGFNSNFFVYGADIDFTLKVRLSGFKIFRLNKVYITQTYGDSLGVETFRSSLFFKLSQIYSYINLRLNAVNSYHSIGYSYSEESIASQIAASRVINHKYSRLVPEMFRLLQKYVIRRKQRGD